MSYIIPAFLLVSCAFPKKNEGFRACTLAALAVLARFSKLIHRAEELKADLFAAMLTGGKDVGKHQHCFVRLPMRLVHDFIDSRCRYLFPRLVQPLEGIGSHERCRVG